MSSPQQVGDPRLVAPNPRLGRVVREAGWIVFLAIGIYLALVLASYQRSDPGPFFSGTGDPIANQGGALGAWLADALLYTFGWSAWWWVALAAYGILRLYRRVETWEVLNRRSLAVSLIGFVVGAFFLSLAYTEMLYTLIALAAGLQKVAQA